MTARIFKASRKTEEDGDICLYGNGEIMHWRRPGPYSPAFVYMANEWVTVYYFVGKDSQNTQDNCVCRLQHPAMWDAYTIVT